MEKKPMKKDEYIHEFPSLIVGENKTPEEIEEIRLNALKTKEELRWEKRREYKHLWYLKQKIKKEREKYAE
jgi:hypothetical protein